VELFGNRFYGVAPVAHVVDLHAGVMRPVPQIKLVASARYFRLA